MLTFTPDDCVSFAIELDRTDDTNFVRSDGRWKYRYTISFAGIAVADAAAITSPSSTNDRPQPLATMLATLLTYFAAYVEALAHEDRTGRRSDNADLFPPACRSLAEALDADQLALWAEEIRGRD
jgi:hypothetical protein